VASGEVVVSTSDLLFQVAHFLRKELNRTATIGADHVVMAAAVVLMFLAGYAVVEGDLAGQAALAQKLQGAVHGGVADASVFLLYEAVEFIRGKVVAGLEKRAQDGIALRGLLQPNSLQMAMKNVLSLADHLAGNRGLVIDAILQHGGKNCHSG
jgi:hypothetical protein